MMIGFDINPQTQELHLKEMEREANRPRPMPERRSADMLQALRLLLATLHRAARAPIVWSARI